ncbi:MAG: hypothetical protein ACTHW1_03335 [Ancrocorticia sp.]|uniref:hypothetical protein n=1 Tax=Ancrocorticia sp. TaxID=2593684 RepID=UPI003F8DC674
MDSTKPSSDPTPYDGLSNPDLQADALIWAEQARAHVEATGTETSEIRKKGQTRTSAKAGPLVESLNLTHLGSLVLRTFNTFVNLGNENTFSLLSISLGWLTVLWCRRLE